MCQFVPDFLNYVSVKYYLNRFEVEKVNACVRYQGYHTNHLWELHQIYKSGTFADKDGLIPF